MAREIGFQMKVWRKLHAPLYVSPYCSPDGLVQTIEFTIPEIQILNSMPNEQSAKLLASKFTQAVLNLQHEEEYQSNFPNGVLLPRSTMCVALDKLNEMKVGFKVYSHLIIPGKDDIPDTPSVEWLDNLYKMKSTDEKAAEKRTSPDTEGSDHVEPSVD